MNNEFYIRATRKKKGTENAWCKLHRTGKGQQTSSFGNKESKKGYLLPDERDWEVKKNSKFLLPGFRRTWKNWFPY